MTERASEEGKSGEGIRAWLTGSGKPHHGLEARALPSRLDKLRVAILPLANISPDPNDLYFADGMTEELISTMSKINGLNVVARTSVVRYKSGERNIEEIARELRVGTILEGSVRKAGERVRITVQIIDSDTSSQLWSESYDREMKDVFAIQADVSEKVATALRIKLQGDEKARLTAEPTTNVDAHALYLKGVYYNANEHLSESGAIKAINCFEQAVKLDPSYAEAHAFLSDSYITMAADGYWSLERALPLAKASAIKAIELKPNSCEGHRSMAVVKFFDSDWKGAESEFKKAIELNPKDHFNHSYWAIILGGLGRFDEAASEVRSALDLSPIDRDANVCLAFILYYQRKFVDAIAHLQRVIVFDPDFAPFHGLLGLCYLKISQYERAIEEFRNGKEQSNRRLCNLAVAYAKMRNVEACGKILDYFLKLADAKSGREQFPPQFAIARIKAAMGMNEEALSYLENAVGQQMYDDLEFDPIYDDLRSDPRFNVLVAKCSPHLIDLRAERIHMPEL